MTSRRTGAGQAVVRNRRGRSKLQLVGLHNKISSVSAKELHGAQTAFQRLIYEIHVRRYIRDAGTGSRNDRAIWRHDYDFGHDSDTLCAHLGALHVMMRFVAMIS